MDASNPTARALRCLELLQDSPGITANRLADKLGVSDRAARRYVAILREAGVLVESVRGRYGGYHVGRGLRLPPLMFSAAEALGLVMAVLDGHHDASDPTDPVGGALGKIMRALPEPWPPRPRRSVRPPRPPRTAPPPGPTPRPRPPSCRPARTTDGSGSGLPHRGRLGMAHRGRPVGGRRTPRPVVPAVSIGPLEPLDAQTTRLVGSTSNPVCTPSNSRRSRPRTGS